MKKSQSSGPSQLQDQHSRFIETARALGCDEDEATFDEKLKAVVGPKPDLKPVITSPIWSLISCPFWQSHWPSLLLTHE